MILESNPSKDAEPHESSGPSSNSSPKPQSPNPNDPDLGSPSSPPKISQQQELTLSYLCENPKLGFQEKEEAPVNNNDGLRSIEKLKSKGKEIVASSSSPPPVERDFLQLKRENPEGAELDGRVKKVKMETLGLSLSPPNLSLSLNNSNQLPAAVPAASARTANSEDFTLSLSYTQSAAFSHNPSCSLTRCSTENYSMSKENDQMWYGGEGTNGSVHSRFRPVGDGNNIAFANPNNELHVNGGNKINNNNNGNENSFYRTASSDNIAFFPSDLPARMGKAPSAESGRPRTSMLTRPDRVLKEIVSDSVVTVAQMLQDFPRESLEALKDCLRNLMEAAEKKDEFVGFQRRLERRSDLTGEILSRANRVQLEMLVAIKTGIVGFLSGKNRVPSSELVEIFMMTRCRNLRCKSILPVDDCDCKICASQKGFCSACMCPICLKFDCASNTCSWVGCDVCSHWCHALCGLQKNFIRPGLNQKLGNGMTEMQFMCPGCDHASEMFGFVKEVFTCCAKEWGLETLMKELDCVKMIFTVSEDFEGKELEKKAGEMFTKLNKKQISPTDACNAMLHFFKYGVSDLSVTGSSSKNILSAQPSALMDTLALPPQPVTVLPPKPVLNLTKPHTSILESQMSSLKPERNPEPKPKPAPLAMDSHFGLPPPKEDDSGFQSLETLVRFKEAEAKLFERLADDARKEVEGYTRIAKAKAEKLEEEYAAKLAKLRLPEAEERRRKKLEELKFLEKSHRDYQNMKVRMQAEIASLLQRMEVTKKQWT